MEIINFELQESSLAFLSIGFIVCMFTTLVDVFLDYFLQSLIFLGSGQLRLWRVSKFLIYRLLDTFIRQLLYIYSLKFPFVQKYLAGEKKQDQDSNVPKFLWHRQTHLRYIMVLLVFFVLTFPMRKYWIFT